MRLERQSVNEWSVAGWSAEKNENSGGAPSREGRTEDRRRRRYTPIPVVTTAHYCCTMTTRAENNKIQILEETFLKKESQKLFYISHLFEF